jgi:hypothetical protein
MRFRGWTIVERWGRFYIRGTRYFGFFSKQAAKQMVKRLGVAK